MGMRIGFLVMALVVLTSLGACEGKRTPSPYEGTFIYRGGGP